MLAPLGCVQPVPAPISSPPTQPAARVSLGDMRICFDALDQARRLYGLLAGEWATAAQLSLNSIIEWRLCRRDPRLSKFIGLADVVGYAVVMRGPDGVETTLRDLPLAVERINDTRIKRGISFADMEARAGVSTSSFFAWRKDRRDPTVANLVAMAQTFGFEIEIIRSW